MKYQPRNEFIAQLVQGENMLFKASDGARLRYRVWQPQVGVEKGYIVCLHGLSANSSYFSKFGNSMAGKGWGVYAFDQRGNGVSDSTASFRRTVMDVREFVEFVRRRGLKKTFLLGHSFGGVYALDYAAENPEGVAGLVLAAPAGRIKFRVSSKNVLKAAVQFASGSMDTTLAWPEPFTDSLTGQFMLGDRLCEKVYPSGFLVKTILMAGRATSYAGKVKGVPVLVLQGGGDEVVSIKKAFKVCEKAGGEWRFYEGADHSLGGAFSPVGQDGSKVFQDIAEWVGRF